MKAIIRIFALLLLAAAVACVFLYHPEAKEDDTPPPVRPIKSMLVGPPATLPTISFPGTVDATAGVDLSFDVSGRIIEFPAVRGMEVKEGDLLARLDDRDYANDVKSAEAELAYYQSNFKRMEVALAQNAVSQDDYYSAKASADKARAALEIAQKALEDTRLNARFGGYVSETYADNYDTVSSGTAILKLQDLSAFDLIVSVPESYVLSAEADIRAEFIFEASFDSLPGRTFPVRVKDAARVADPVTQTYRATFTLDAPEGINILPGMTCTVSATIPESEIPAVSGGYLVVPSGAVGAAADKSSFVWRLEDNGDGTYTVRRATVTLGERSGEDIYVLSGLNAGDRIAVAGVTVLTEGRIVRLLDDADLAAAAGETIPTEDTAADKPAEAPAEP